MLDDILTCPKVGQPTVAAVCAVGTVADPT